MWTLKCYYDIMLTKEEGPEETFAPIMI